MGTVRLTRTELAALDAMIETLKEKGSATVRKVPLRSMAPPMLTTVVIDATKIVGAGTRILPEDTKILKEVEKLIAQLKGKISLADLLELRRSAAGRKRSAAQRKS
jgi:hypothetical protein